MEAGILVWLFVAMYAAFVGVALFKLLPKLSKGKGLPIAEPVRPVQPERVQAVAITMATPAMLGFWGGQEVAAKSGYLPDIPRELLALLGTSQATLVSPSSRLPGVAIARLTRMARRLTVSLPCSSSQQFPWCVFRLQCKRRMSKERAVGKVVCAEAIGNYPLIQSAERGG